MCVKVFIMLLASLYLKVNIFLKNVLSLCLA